MSSTLYYGAWCVDPLRGEAHRPGEVVGLSATECKLLVYLRERADQTLSRDELLTQVWGYHPSTQSRTLDTTVRRIRAKLEPTPDQPTTLVTVFGEGYRWVSSPRSGPAAVEAEPLRPFFGRTAELATLARHVSEGTPWLTLTGPPGIGKSRLLSHFLRETGTAHLHTDLLDLREEAGVLHALAHTLGLTNFSTLPSLTDLTKALPRRPLLWVIEHPERAKRLVGPLFFRLQQLAPTLKLWFTSHSPLQAASEARMPILGLLPTDAQAMLSQRASLSSTLASLTLLQKLEHHPLAIELAASRLRQSPPEVLLAELDLPRALHTTSGVADRHKGLDRAVESAWDGLSPEDQQVALWCTLFPGSFPLDAVEAVAGEAADAVLESLEHLCELGFLTFDRKIRQYRLWWAVRKTGQHLWPPREKERSEERFLAYWQARATDALERYRKRGNDADLQWLAGSMSALLAASQRTNDLRSRYSLLLALTPLLPSGLSTSSLRELPSLQEPSLRELPDEWRLRVSDARAAACIERAEFADAQVDLDERMTLALASTSPDSGIALARMARHAADLFIPPQKALHMGQVGLQRLAEWPYQRAMASLPLVLYLHTNDETPRALQILEECAHIADHLQHSALKHWVSGLRGMVSPEKALALAESAVEHSGALDPLAHGYAHMRLALLRMQAHDLEAALAEALLGQAVFQQLGHAKHNASVLETLGHIYLWRGELDSAELSLREFQTFAQSTGWERGNAHAQRHLAQIAFLRSEWNATIGLGTPLLSPCKASFDLALEEALLGSELAMAHALMGNSKEALALAISAAQPTNSALVWARLCCIGEWAKHAEAPLWRNEAQRLSQKPESDASQKWALELLNSLAPPCEQGDPNAQVNRQWLRSISKFT